MIPSPKHFTLIHRWHRRKDYSHFKTFGLSLAPLPTNLSFVTTILDQGDTPQCTAYSAVGARTAETSKEYNPTAQWDAELAFMGVKTAQGSDIETELATGVETGFMPLAGHGTPAYGDKASAYFFVHKAKGLDLFDSIRTVLAQTNRPMVVGLDWYADWNVAGGIVPYSYHELMGGHAIKIAGVTTIDDVPYLIVQNSWGKDVGDNGLFYFPRAVVNKSFTISVGYWADSTDVQVQKLGLLAALWANLVALWNTIYTPSKPPPVTPVPPPPVPVPVPPPPPPPVLPLYDWSTHAASKHSARVICDEVGLTSAWKNILDACIEAESGYNNNAKHINLNINGVEWSTDWGIVQVNDYYHIGTGKDFPSVEYVLENRAHMVRWMATLFKQGKADLWSSYTSGEYKKYLAK